MSSYTQPIATPLTRLATSAHFERSKIPSDVPFEDKARHLHFTWDETVFKLDTSNLKEVLVGDWRYSCEGVRYQQLYVIKPLCLEWYVDGDQFQHVEANATGMSHYKDGFIVTEYQRYTTGGYFPDGALYSVGADDSDSSGWVKNEMGYIVAPCEKNGGEMALGKPTLPPKSNSLDHRIGRSVRDFARKVSQELKKK